MPRTWELAIQFGCAVDDFIEMSDNLSDQQKAEIKGLSMQAMCGMVPSPLQQHVQES